MDSSTSISASVRFAKISFTAAGIFGVIALFPLFFLEDYIGKDVPPAITHPEFFYLFLGCAFVWQFVYLLIGTNPVRYRTAMILAALAKFTVAGCLIVLYLLNRIGLKSLAAGTPDLLLGLLFAVCFLKTKQKIDA
jgi:hypothetical protein